MYEAGCEWGDELLLYAIRELICDDVDELNREDSGTSFFTFIEKVFQYSFIYTHNETH